MTAENSGLDLWDLPAQTGSVDDLRRWAELLAAHRLGEEHRVLSAGARHG